VPAGSTAADALQATVALAVEAERLGYRRIWLAEHHNTESLAGTAPEVLAAHVAGRTSTIRVGSGGVLLSHYPALKVAEVFRTLEALFPGRIDLGLGRADGADRAAVRALHDGGDGPSEEGYRQRLAELLLYLEDGNGANQVGREHAERPARESYAGPSDGGPEGAERPEVVAWPRPPRPPEVWVLGSSSVGATLAAESGVPFCFAHFVSPTFGHQVMDLYRRRFCPSCRYPEPRASVGVTVICADTDARAEALAASGDVWALRPEGRRRGALLPPEDAAASVSTPLEHEFLAQHRQKRITGAPDRVAATLLNLADAYQVDELVVRTVCYDPADRLHSYRLLAEACAGGTGGVTPTR